MFPYSSIAHVNKFRQTRFLHFAWEAKAFLVAHGATLLAENRFLAEIFGNFLSRNTQKIILHKMRFDPHDVRLNQTSHKLKTQETEILKLYECFFF